MFVICDLVGFLSQLIKQIEITKKKTLNTNIVRKLWSYTNKLIENILGVPCNHFNFKYM